jgi:hypothetical protein
LLEVSILFPLGNAKKVYWDLSGTNASCTFLNCELLLYHQGRRPAGLYHRFLFWRIIARFLLLKKTPGYQFKGKKDGAIHLKSPVSDWKLFFWGGCGDNYVYWLQF